MLNAFTKRKRGSQGKLPRFLLEVNQISSYY